MIPRNELRNLAKARLRDAEVLVDADRFAGANYICGYAIELWLKFRICKTLRWSGFPGSNNEFQGFTSFKIHDLDRLLRLSGIEDRVKSKFFTEWSIVSEWNPESRYNSNSTITRADAESMIKSARILLRMR